ncbi:transposase [Larkinella punicea]|uniref:transposase n=1 Tax=Larkinella punicea TaxID=2315727 RepID=UPI0035B5A52B
MSLQTPTGQPALWQFIENYLPTQRKRRLCLRHVTNAIFYILRTGCQWRNLPSHYPHWQAVYRTGGPVLLCQMEEGKSFKSAQSGFESTRPGCSRTPTNTFLSLC